MLVHDYHGFMVKKSDKDIVLLEVKHKIFGIKCSGI